MLPAPVLRLRTAVSRLQGVQRVRQAIARRQGEAIGRCQRERSRQGSAACEACGAAWVFLWRMTMRADDSGSSAMTVAMAVATTGKEERESERDAYGRVPTRFYSAEKGEREIPKPLQQHSPDGMKRMREREGSSDEHGMEADGGDEEGSRQRLRAPVCVSSGSKWRAQWRPAVVQVAR